MPKKHAHLPKIGNIIGNTVMNKRMEQKTRNYFRGAASALQLWPSTPLRMKEVLSARSDLDALRQDWQRVGEDIKSAVKKYEHEQADT